MEYKSLKGYLRDYHPIFWAGLIGIGIFAFLYTTSVRNVLYLEFLLLPITLSVLGFIFKYDRKIWKKAAVYFATGLSWEVLTEAYWTYGGRSLSLLYFYKDIPIAMLLYWMSIFSLAFFLFSHVNRRMKVNKPLAQILTVFGVFLTAEAVGFNVFRVWDYNFNPIFLIPVYSLPLHILVAYLILGNMFLISMREKLYKPQNVINLVPELARNPSKTVRRLVGMDEE